MCVFGLWELDVLLNVAFFVDAVGSFFVFGVPFMSIVFPYELAVLLPSLFGALVFPYELAVLLSSLFVFLCALFCWMSGAENWARPLLVFGIFVMCIRGLLAIV